MHSGKRLHLSSPDPMHGNAPSGASRLESETERNRDRQQQREVASKVLCSVQAQWGVLQPGTPETLLFHSIAAAAETFQLRQASWSEGN